MIVAEIHQPSGLSRLGPVFIYGTGAAGRWMKAACDESEGTTVEGFLDTFQSGTCEGLPVLHPQALRQRPADGFTVVIASMYAQEILQVLVENGIRNAVNAYPCFTHAKLRTVSDIEQVSRQLVEFLIRERPGRRIAVFGHRQSAMETVAGLQASEAASRLVAHYDDEHIAIDPLNRRRDRAYGDYAAGRAFDCAVLVMPQAPCRDTIRYLVDVCGLPVELLVPTNVTDGATLERDERYPLVGTVPRNAERALSSPMVLVVPPCAGTHRLMPPMQAILQHYGWLERSYMSLIQNTYYLSRYRAPAPVPPFERLDELHTQIAKDAAETVHAFARLLNHWEFMWVHDAGLDLTRFADIGGPVVVLMRDPRDIINSYYFRYFKDSPETREQNFLTLLDGVTFMGTPKYHFRWPSAKYWTDSYLDVLGRENYYILRFEDLHNDPVRTYRRLLTDLGLDRDPITPMSDAKLRDCIKLGTFEHQTGGRASRGEDRREIVLLPNGIETSCRKGVTGDWRNNFTPRVVERFKELTGDALVRLGYEADADWHL
ncbi:sulfotransferase domain-containing protein [Azospirillum sp. Vi22]|uniref:sulfotransferase domain-containing protein n=1 Tax=Azospirillum baldaniorum TaxID=1064539 RepID=UPI00157A5028|nr:sulfotransferase domain-containing protein [Azospirillum baldaniorum]NUB05040.1 sulfotransferase domain-containing protein [Azospirillum baldaniorum]